MHATINPLMHSVPNNNVRNEFRPQNNKGSSKILTERRVYESVDYRMLIIGYILEIVTWNRTQMLEGKME